MTAEQVVINARALRNMAARLEGFGIEDAYTVAERLVVNLLSDGYRPVQRPQERETVPGPSTSTPEARREALRTAQEAVDAAKRRITGRVDT